MFITRPLRAYCRLPVSLSRAEGTDGDAVARESLSVGTPVVASDVPRDRQARSFSFATRTGFSRAYGALENGSRAVRGPIVDAIRDTGSASISQGDRRRRPLKSLSRLKQVA